MKLFPVKKSEQKNIRAKGGARQYRTNRRNMFGDHKFRRKHKISENNASALDRILKKTYITNMSCRCLMSDTNKSYDSGESVVYNLLYCRYFLYSAFKSVAKIANLSL